MNEPALSVIIPVYNSGDYVLEAVQSILDQDCDANFEIVLVNDHSTDSATIEALARLQNQAPEIRVLDNPGRQGPGAARNVGIRAARGTWIAFLDADDVWPPGSLEARWKLADSVPGAAWIAGHYLVWDGKRSLTRPPIWKSPVFDKATRTDTYLRFHDFAGDLVGSNMLVCTCTTIIKRQLLEEVGLFREDLVYGEDWLLFMTLALRADLIFVPSVVAHVRRNHSSLTARAAAVSPLSYKAWKLAYFDPLFRRFRRKIRWKIRAINRDHCEHHHRKGNNFMAVKHALLALLWAPNDIGQWKIVLQRLADLFSSDAADG